eukprot:COSAG03_NODE_344_length_8812_cov_3.890049_3_plen_154_part_00
MAIEIFSESGKSGPACGLMFWQRTHTQTPTHTHTHSEPPLPPLISAPSAAPLPPLCRPCLPPLSAASPPLSALRRSPLSAALRCSLPLSAALCRSLPLAAARSLRERGRCTAAASMASSQPEPETGEDAVLRELDATLRKLRKEHEDVIAQLG